MIGSDCEDDPSFRNTPFFGVDIAYMLRQHRKSLLAAGVVDKMRHVKELLAEPILVHLPSLDQANRAWCHEGKWT